MLCYVLTCKDIAFIILQNKSDKIIYLTEFGCDT